MPFFSQRENSSMLWNDNVAETIMTYCHGQRQNQTALLLGS